jgi:hypothetical protein
MRAEKNGFFSFRLPFSWLSTQSGMNKSAKGGEERAELESGNCGLEAEWTMNAICGSSRA